MRARQRRREKQAGVGSVLISHLRSYELSSQVHRRDPSAPALDQALVLEAAVKTSIKLIVAFKKPVV